MSGKSVLIVDDHPAITESLSLAIREIDPSMKVEVANSMFQVMAKLSESQDFEFCLLDLMLRDTKGQETLLAMRRAAPDLPVIVYTGLEIVGLESFCRDNCVIDFIHKSASRNVLIKALEKRLPKRDVSDRSPVHLTARQRGVLELLLCGCSVREIASNLNIAETTVQTHVRALNEAGNCRNRMELASWARSIGVVAQGVK
jgi:DNA-binding NarL/FixJ family response regulator